MQKTPEKPKAEAQPHESPPESGSIVEAEVISESGGIATAGSERSLAAATVDDSSGLRERKKAVRLYIFLPLLFLTVSLLGGLRLAAPDGAFVFVAPALVCLIFAVVLVGLFLRGGLIALEGWFSDTFTTLQDASNGVVLITLFAASAQVFNSVIPESGLPFWVVTFCFAWTLWNNLFSEFDNKKLLKSIAALFAFAFVAKYIILAGMTAPSAEGGWLRSMIENPGRETVTWLLDLPRYSAGTGYIQFFCLLLYFIGLYLLPRSTAAEFEK